MRLQSLPVRTAILGFFCLFLGACAAQSSFKAYHDARDLLNRARELDPEHPFLSRAEVELEAGRRALNEARYSRAGRSFKQVSRDAEKVIVAKDPQYRPEFISERELGATEALSELERRSEEGLSSADLSNQEQIEWEAPVDSARMELPAAALAKYLAQKKSTEAPSPKPQNQAPPSKPVPKPAPEPVRAVEPPRTERKEKLPEPPQKLPFERRKLEQVISFVPGESTILPGARDELDRLSRLLAENPSYTLVFRAQHAVGETAELSQSRFENVQAYLEGKGVPVDQVQLDRAAQSATTPLFELYVIEH